MCICTIFLSVHSVSGDDRLSQTTNVWHLALGTKRGRLVSEKIIAKLNLKFWTFKIRKKETLRTKTGLELKFLEKDNIVCSFDIETFAANVTLAGVAFWYDTIFLYTNGLHIPWIHFRFCPWGCVVYHLACIVEPMGLTGIGKVFTFATWVSVEYCASENATSVTRYYNTVSFFVIVDVEFTWTHVSRTGFGTRI